MSCLAPLRHRLVPGSRLSQLFICLQRGFNCVAKTYNCMLLDLIQKREIFKRIVLDNRLHTMLFYYLTHQVEIKENPMAAFRLRQAVMNFAKSTYLHWQRGTIREEEYYGAIATIRDMIKTVPITLTRSPKQILMQPIDEARLAEQVLAARNKRMEHARKLRQLKPQASQNPRKKLKSVNPLLGKNCKWEDLNSLLNTLSICSMNLSFAYQIECLAQNLRHLKDIPCVIDPKIAASNLNHLYSLGTNYAKGISNSKMWQSCAAQNACMEFLALAYRLALVCDGEKHILERFGIHFDYFERQGSLFLFAMHDPIQLDHRNELIRFFSKLPSAWRLCNFENEEFNHRLFYEGMTAESQLLQLYFPEISQSDRMKYYLEPEKWKKTHDYIAILNGLAGFTTSLFKFRSRPLQVFYTPFRSLLSTGKLEYFAGEFNWKSQRSDEGYEYEYAEIPVIEEKEKSSSSDEEPKKKASLLFRIVHEERSLGS